MINLKTWQKATFIIGVEGEANTQREGSRSTYKSGRMKGALEIPGL